MKNPEPFGYGPRRPKNAMLVSKKEVNLKSDLNETASSGDLVVAQYEDEELGLFIVEDWDYLSGGRLSNVGDLKPIMKDLSIGRPLSASYVTLFKYTGKLRVQQIVH